VFVLLQVACDDDALKLKWDECDAASISKDSQSGMRVRVKRVPLREYLRSCNLHPIQSVKGEWMPSN
jgi:hypothetical protein